MDVSGRKKETFTNTKLDTKKIPILDHVRTPLPNKVEELETIKQLTDYKIIKWYLILNEKREKGSAERRKKKEKRIQD